MNPYLGNFNQPGDYTYERCTLYPFYKLDKRQPPLWFYKLILNKLVSAAYNWDMVFKELGQPYDLQVWLYDPSYMWSEIICYRLDKQIELKTRFVKSLINKSFPDKKFGLSINNNEFEWYLADEDLVYFEDDFDCADFTKEEIIADGYVKKQSDEFGDFYIKRIGDLWVGRKKSP
ncbi:hypothetical protein FO440_01905 [Mucilaginibacter corticis]|uniref:Uncharacterized protein n=2 Tax=Mucilaginibacter corticis TaxID=2597670 RepID=A0A556MSP3_9SPHI|nr:hypothetical protein FO440_01905 [Mucilaginibacter corticis]